MLINISQEQIDFLHQHGFYYNTEEYPFIYGRIGRNCPEFYNMESVNELIEEIKIHGKPLEDAHSAQFKSHQGTFYIIDRSKIQFVDQKICKDTRELVIDDPVKPAWSPQKKSVYMETDEWCDIVYRRNGEFGDGSQFLERIYKSREFAQKACIPLLEKEKETFVKRVGYIEELIKTYKS